MADYLSALAARALGVANVARPRPAARFEPQPMEEFESLSTPDRRRSAHRSIEHSPADTEPVRMPATREPVRTPGEREPVVATGEDRFPTFAAPSAAEAALPTQPIPPPRRRNDEPAAPRTERPSIPPVREVPTSRIDRTPGTPTRREARREAQARAATAAAPEPPAVHVTIGRIEVRAVTSPAAGPAPRSRRHPTPLSLDEYLEQRRSGRR
jgi:hypothetical protein